MNQTDEFILDALREQGVVTDELIAEVNGAIEAQADGPKVGNESSFMDELLVKTGILRIEHGSC